MTLAQRLFYRDVFLRHADFISRLGNLQELNGAYRQRLALIDDLLLKCCDSLFLINESILELIDNP